MICRKTLLLGGALAAAIWFVYAPALHGDWTWDDDRYVTQNSLLHSLAGLGTLWFRPGATFDYYPVTATVQWLQWHAWGLDPAGYHLTNFALHFLNALLVWRVFSRLGLRLAWFGALLFAIHPAQVESVAWISELKNTLSLFLLLGAACLYLEFDATRRPRPLGLAVVVFVLALLSKLTVVFFPCVLLLHAWWKRGRIGAGDLAASAPFFAASLVVGLITIFAGNWARQFGHAVPFDGGMPARVALAGEAMAFYLEKALLPVGLMPVYPMWAVDARSVAGYLPWVILASIIGVCWWARKSWGRAALLGVGFFVVNLLPCPGFIPPPNMGFAWVMDHFLYLPLIGVIGLVVAGLGAWSSAAAPSVRFSARVFMVVVAVALAGASRAYAAFYGDPEQLWAYNLEHNPAAWPAHANLGVALFHQRRLAEAASHLEQALRLNPDAGQSHDDYGAVLLESGRLAQAQQEFEQTLRIGPETVQVRTNLGAALAQQDHFDEAVAQYRLALKLDPDSADAHNGMAGALARMGRLEEAVTEFRLALAAEPDFAEAHFNLGITLMRLNRVPEAVGEFEETLRLNPGLTVAQAALDRAHAMQGGTPATPASP